jgi:hypothetical protein
MGVSMILVQRIERLQPVMDSWLGQPFVWGVSDCAHLCAEMMMAAGYVNPLADIGAYHSQLTAKRQLRKAGYQDLDAALDGLGLERIAPAMALPGDLVALPGEGGWTALGIAIGQGRAMAFCTDRCVWGPLADCTTAWRLECPKLP